uniref:Uncharacterized protein n=1 Tax=Oryza rufipogon TaxID=4529 RepID=A0A0E0R8I5_ORYRU
MALQLPQLESDIRLNPILMIAFKRSRSLRMTDMQISHSGLGRLDRRCVAGLTGRVRARVCFVGSRVFLAWEGMFRLSFGFYPELDVEEGLWMTRSTPI